MKIEVIFILLAVLFSLSLGFSAENRHAQGWMVGTGELQAEYKTRLDKYMSNNLPKVHNFKGNNFDVRTYHIIESRNASNNAFSYSMIRLNETNYLLKAGGSAPQASAAEDYIERHGFENLQSNINRFD